MVYWVILGQYSFLGINDKKLLFRLSVFFATVVLYTKARETNLLK